MEIGASHLLDATSISHPVALSHSPSISSMSAAPEVEFLYGINPAFEVVRAGRRTVNAAFLNDAARANPRLKRLSSLLRRGDIPVEWTGKDRLFRLCRHREHQGVVLQVGRYPYCPYRELFDARRLLLLDNVEDPQNVGAILRSAEVFGFHSVLLAVRGVPPVYPSVVKASAGACEFLRISRQLGANKAFRRSRESGYVVIALDAKGDRELEEIDEFADRKLMLVVGGEDRSVGQYILRRADYVVRLWQHGRVNSLNASVAAGIAMFVLSSN